MKMIQHSIITGLVVITIASPIQRDLGGQCCLVVFVDRNSSFKKYPSRFRKEKRKNE